MKFARYEAHGKLACGLVEGDKVRQPTARLVGESDVTYHTHHVPTQSRGGGVGLAEFPRVLGASSRVCPDMISAIAARYFPEQRHF